MNPQTISDQMMINLNYSDVQEFKEKVGIKKRYTGELKRLVDVEFPDEMEPIGNPPVNENVDVSLQVVDELLEEDFETYTDSEDDSENSEDNNSSESDVN